MSVVYETFKYAQFTDSRLLSVFIVSEYIREHLIRVPLSVSF